MLLNISTMMYLFTFALLLFISGIHGDSTPNCPNLPDNKEKEEWRNMGSNCTDAMIKQINVELTAAMTYLAMGSHFLQDKVNRPGFAKMFLESASEERQHSIMLLEYLLMRGELIKHDQFVNLINDPKPIQTEWQSGMIALQDALALETKVTKDIRNIIVTCETPPAGQENDYHLVDYLTGDFLEEQYRGQRDLAGKLSTLSKMSKTHGVLGEFLYDKTLL